MRGHRGIAPLVVALLLAAPRVAHACAVCFDARDENRAAFLATTVFMSLLPLGMVAGLVLWLRRRAQVMEQGTEDRG